MIPIDFLVISGFIKTGISKRKCSKFVSSFQGGGYLLDLLDYYAAGWPYLFIGFTELVIIGHIYGLNNFIDDLNTIKKFKMGDWTFINVSFLYKTLSPAIILVRIHNCCWSCSPPAAECALVVNYQF